MLWLRCPVLALALVCGFGSGVWPEAAKGDGKVDLNTASFAELRALPGMGDEYARRVIRFRPYTAKNQLATKGVLPVAEYERIQALVVAHRSRQLAAEK